MKTAMMTMSRASRTVACRRMVQRSAHMASLRRARRGSGQYGLGHPDGLGHRADLVDPEDPGAPAEAQDGRRDGPLQPLPGRRPEHQPDESLPRDPQAEGTPQLPEGLQAVEDLEVVGGRLAEADAGVEDDPLGRDAGRPGLSHPRGQEAPDLAEEVVV